MQRIPDVNDIYQYDGGVDQQTVTGPVDPSTSAPVSSTTYGDTRIGDNARVHLGDQHLLNHGIVINANNVDINDRTLQSLARLDLNSHLKPRTFGLCLGQAPQLDEEAYIGRMSELQQLQEWFPQDNQNQKIVSIVGMGGLGKTQLSLAYARRNRDRYASLFWLNAKDEPSLRQSLILLAKLIFGHTHDQSSSPEDEEDQVQRVRAWLSEEWNTSWLLLFDNYDDPRLPNIRSDTGFDVRNYFPDRSQGHILITTRSPKLMFSKRLILRKLDDIESSLAILSQRAARELNDEVKARELAARLDGLPLALASAGVYLGQTGISCTEYLELYDTAWTDLHGPGAEELIEYENRTLASTWTISFDQVNKLDADAAELLKFWVYFNNKDIWFELIRTGAEYGPDWMRRVTMTKIRFDRAMVKLQDYSLVEAVEGSYNIHPCVHTWISEHFGIDMTGFKAALNCVAGGFHPPGSGEFRSRAIRLVSHNLRLNEVTFQKYWEECLTEQDIAGMSHICAQRLLVSTPVNVEYAEAAYLRTVRAYEQAFGHNAEQTLNILVEVANIYEAYGRLSEAAEYYSKALVGMRRILGTNNSKTLSTTFSLGQIYRLHGKPDKAEELLSQVVAGEQPGPEPDNWGYLASLLYLVDIYQLQGRLDESEQRLSQLLCALRKVGKPITYVSNFNDVTKVLIESIKNNINYHELARSRLAVLVASYNFWLSSASHWKVRAVAQLARTLLWFGDKKNSSTAFSYTRATCDGCDRDITLDTGRHVCRQCLDTDLCNDCVTSYGTKDLNVSGCEGHEHFDIGSAIPELMDTATETVTAGYKSFIKELVQTYPLPADEQEAWLKRF